MNLASLVNTAFRIGGKLLHDSPLVLLDKAGAELQTLPVGTFIGEYVQSLEFGDTYLRIQLADSAAVTLATLSHTVTARFAGATYTVARDEDPVTTDRVQKLRLMPADRKKP
jgi:hypothetical protein